MSSLPQCAPDRKTSLPSQLLHDLRSPLNQIIGYSELLGEEVDLQWRDGFAGDIELIRAAGQRMLEIIEESFTALDEKPASRTSRVAAAEFNADSAVVRRQLSVGPGLLLVVDDLPANRDVLSRRLKRQGHDVRTAESGREALQMMRDTDFDLVLLDIMMPDMDGYDVLGQIKADETLGHIPVIMISALNEPKSVVRCIQAGAEDYLAKPFNPTLLKARINACLEKKRGHDREAILFDQLRENYKRLEELEKLRDDMRNMIVHDLRTPLTSVIVGVEMLEKYGDLNPVQREMMGIAAGGGRTLLGMINDLLDVEKMESGTTQLLYRPLSAASLVTSAVSQVASLAEEAHTTVAMRIEPALPSFAGDENKLTRTLVNLIANAIRFTPEGTVTVTASQDEAGKIRFSVSDTGKGIPAEAFGRIFEKFGQLDSRDKVGTGLGLAFCKLAVEAHGGSIGVQSTPGVGSEFSFTIPLVAIAQ